ncbi:MAG: hypothetical protein FD159_1912 [Syntrophaceae bacterium]|nr:MAG: hypothetical protein FD159_1912 [Syntrophaceae bacterium]
MKCVVLSVMGFFMMISIAVAGHPLVTDDAGTQGRGKGQMEFGLSLFRDKDKIDELTTLKAEGGEATIGVTVGLVDSLDVVLSVPYLWFTVDGNDTRLDHASGLSDINLGAKWRFLEKDGWALAIKPGISLPSGDEDKGLDSGHTDYRLFLIASKEFEPVALHFNLGFIRHQNNADARKDIWHASLAAEVAVIKDLKLLANVGIERNLASDSETHPAFVLVGISYDVSERITVDAGIKYSLTSPETDWTYLTGLTIKF